MLKKALPTTALCAALMLTTPLFAADAQTKDTSTGSPTQMQFGDVGHTNADIKNIHHTGRLLLKRIKINESTIVNGYLQAIDSKFIQQTVINGHIKALNSQFNELTVNGDTELKGSIVLGPANINGKIFAEHSKFDNVLNVNGQLKGKDSSFKKMVSLNSSESDFENCTIQDITVGKDEQTKMQVLNLKNTKVLGKVDFESGNGVIHADAASSIAGKVTGGTMQK